MDKINRLFKKVDGSSVDLVNYTGKILSAQSGTAIIVGTDSQNTKMHTTFVTVVAYRHGRRGVHIIYKKIVTKKYKNIVERLLKEVEHSIDCAELLKDSGSFVVDMIELDVNDDKKYKSNVITKSAIGWCQGMGYNCSIKPDAQIAAKAADMLCH